LEPAAETAEKIKRYRNIDPLGIEKPDELLAIAQGTVEGFRARGLHTPADVYALTRFGIPGTKIGTKHNCKMDDHGAPFDFVADVLLGRTRDFIVWANRAGSKSYLAGLITWIKSSYSANLETVILGGSLEQSEKSYKAMGDFWAATQLEDRYLKHEPQKTKTQWRNGSQAAILAASPKSVRGPHPQLLLMDEIDEMEQEIYDAALSMPQSKKNIPATIGKLSTNHRFGGIMDAALQAIEEAAEEDALAGDIEQRGMGRIYKWCIWECLEPCVDYQCSTCKLSKWCPGEHMKEADGYYLIDDFLQKLRNVNEFTLEVEWFCNKIGRGDLIYGDFFNEDIHCASDLPGFAESREVVISVDFGGSAPFSVGAWQFFPKLGWVRIDEIYKAHTTNAKIIAEAKTRPWWRRVKEGVCDPSRKDSRIEWIEAGVALRKGNNDLEEGLDATANAMAPVSGRPHFFVNRRCKDWRREVKGYRHKNDIPIKENDHAMDETRYFVMEYLIRRRGGRAGVRSI
jgi:hypothetical protein